MPKNTGAVQRPDPRGPVRQIVSIEERSDGTLLTKSCGHTSRYNQTFHYTIGASVRCMQCREAAEGGSNAQ